VNTAGADSPCRSACSTTTVPPARSSRAATHDPALALWSGEDGLDAVRVVERVAARLLRAGGTVVVEHADLQGESAPAVFTGAGWADVRDHPDLAGRDRYLTARRAQG